MARLKVIQARLAAEEEERKIKEQIAKEKEEGDKILQLSFLDAGDAVLLRVEDNGMGMEQSVAESLVTYQAEGYGLKNVNDRICLLYGEEYKIRITSSVGKGTVVEMRIPKGETS